MPDNNTLREFSYSHPIKYKGVSYPSASANILTDGQQTPGNVFADANGNYFVLGDNDTAKSVMPVHSLDEVVVTPSKENLLSTQFNEYLTQNNDQTQIFDTPHREYNPHLRNKAIKGALSHNLWEQEHPNLSAWSQALSAVPFAVASTPLVGALSQSALATTAGQTARAGIASLMSNPIVDAANTGLGLGFAVKGVYDVSQGEFTPETAMDLAGGAGLMFKSLTGLRKARKPFVSELDWSPEGWFGKYKPNEYDVADVSALKSHIQEYHNIERQAKANGNWLTMPDDSKWEGDPRGWVMLQSKNVKNNYRNEVLHHGEDTYFDDMSFYTDEEGNNMTGDMLGDRVVWTSTNSKIAPTYGKDVYPFIIPKNTNIKTVANAEGKQWGEVLPNTSTDDLVYPNLTENNVIRIDNVVDPGPNIQLTKIKDALPNETIPMYISRKYIGDDLVLGQKVRRKSLYGNNGNFDLNNSNIFKGLIPIGLGISGNSLYNQSHK